VNDARIVSELDIAPEERPAMELSCRTGCEVDLGVGCNDRSGKRSIERDSARTGKREFNVEQVRVAFGDRTCERERSALDMDEDRAARI
jgi:hypothetical protein